GRLDPAPVVRRGLERGADPVEQLVHVVTQDLEVEVTLGVEVLVEDGLGDPGRDGDAVHAGGVEALVHEHGTGGVDELPTPGAARQAGRPHAHGVRRGRSIGPCHRRLLSSRADPGTSGPDGHYPYRRSADPGDHTACGILESSNRADAEVRGWVTVVAGHRTVSTASAPCAVAAGVTGSRSGRRPGRTTGPPGGPTAARTGASPTTRPGRSRCARRGTRRSRRRAAAGPSPARGTTCPGSPRSAGSSPPGGGARMRSPSWWS